MTTQPTDTERLSRLEGAYEHLATKADVAEVKTDVAEIKGELGTVEARLEARMADMESRLIKWTVGAIVGASAVVAVIVRLAP